MNTYISNSKFQFITDFSKHTYIDIKGKEHELNFNDLTIAERIMLSSYLTFLCSTEDQKMQTTDLYSLIFEFNGNKRKTSYHDFFIEDLSNFIARQPYYFAFVKTHYNDIIDNKSFIYRQQLNHSEMELLYSLKFQRNYHSLMNVLYIIGVSKQNITTPFLNKIDLLNIYSNVTMAKKRVEEIFKKINSVSVNEVKYTISNNTLYFGNGFNVEEAEKYQSVEKQQFNKMLADQEIINNLIVKPEVKIETAIINKPKPVIEKRVEKPVEEPVEVIETKTTEVEQNSLSIENMRVIDALRLGEERKFTPAIFKRLYSENEIHGDHIKKTFDGLGERLKNEGKNLTTLLRGIVVKYNIDGAALLRTYKNLYKIVKGESLGENWKEIKDNARIEQQAFLNKMCASLTKLYDDVDVDEITYMYVVYYVVKSYGEVLNREI